jgi:endonuclease/exonuclease/phosphatase family metal-dependent hydrolase
MKAKRKTHLADKIIFALNIVASLLLLLSYLAPFTDPRRVVFIAMLGFVYYFLVLANVPFIIYWGFRKPRFMFISGIVILLGCHTAGLYFGFNKQPDAAAKPQPTSHRLLQYNVRGFAGVGDYQNKSTKKQILDVIESQRPDLITMEEFGTDKLNSDSVISSLGKILKANSYYFKVYSQTPANRFGNAILSRYPIVDTGSFRTDRKLRTKVIFADIKYNGAVIRIYCIHLKAVNINIEAKKQYLNGEIELGKSPFVLGRIDTAFTKRTIQVEAIRNHIKLCPYPFIIAGDFNDTPNSFAVNELGRGLKNAFTEKGAGLQTTYYAKLPLRIDYVLASPQFDVLSYMAIDRKISDHKPVIIDVRLNAEKKQ